MKICSYIVKNDTGLAPNPFWDCCTLAICTPNHQGIKLGEGNWIIGTESRASGGKLIYAMRVKEKMYFDKYFRDNRFRKKKPIPSGTLKERCGDNMYFHDMGQWHKIPSHFHNSRNEILQDTKHPYVYISDHFYYFGENAIHIPEEFSEIIRNRQGCKCNHREGLMEGFIKWLESSYKPDIYGLPKNLNFFERDSDLYQSCKKALIEHSDSEHLLDNDTCK